MALALAALIPVLGNIFNRIFPNPRDASDAKLEVMRMAKAGELAQLNADLQLATGQIEINKVEAASQSLFVAGWRPAIGWVCGAAFAFKFILNPSAIVVMVMAGYPITLPEFDISEMHHHAGTARFGQLAHRRKGQGRGIMDFHLASPRGDLYLFSTEDGRSVSFPAAMLDVHTVKAAHEIQGPADESRTAGYPRQKS